MKIDFNERLSKGKVVYDRLAMLQNQILNASDSNIEVYFHNSRYVGRNFTFILGCLPVLGKQHQKTVRLFLPPKIMTHMNNMDIVDYYRDPATKFQRFQRIESMEDILSIVLKIIKDAPVTLSDELEELLISRIGEIYNNASEHSKADYVMGGKYFKSHGTYCFSCYDTGIGIAENVREYLKMPMTDSEALQWAIQPQNTTKPDFSRGLGLSLILKFASVNKGEVHICTGNVLLTVSDKGYKWGHLQNKFIGTLFEMYITPDNINTYKIKRNRL